MLVPRHVEQPAAVLGVEERVRHRRRRESHRGRRVLVDAAGIVSGEGEVPRKVLLLLQVLVVLLLLLLLLLPAVHRRCPLAVGQRLAAVVSRRGQEVGVGGAEVPPPHPVHDAVEGGQLEGGRLECGGGGRGGGGGDGGGGGRGRHRRRGGGRGAVELMAVAGRGGQVLLWLLWRQRVMVLNDYHGLGRQYYGAAATSSPSTSAAVAAAAVAAAVAVEGRPFRDRPGVGDAAAAAAVGADGVEGVVLLLPGRGTVDHGRAGAAVLPRVVRLLDDDLSFRLLLLQQSHLVHFQ